MKINFLKLFQNTSLDVVLGGVVLLHFYCQRYNVRCSLTLYLLLATSIWMIYTIDHVRDSLNIKKPIKSRYLFHKEHKKIIAIALLCIGSLSIFLIFHIPEKIMCHGITLLGCSLFYLIFEKQWGNFGLKEILIASIYTSGILLVPFTFLNKIIWLDFLLLWFLVLNNLLLFSYQEYQKDKREQLKTIVFIFGAKRMEKIIIFNQFLFLLFLCYLILFQGWKDYFFFILSIGIYSYLFNFRNNYVVRKYFKLIADGVFFLPIIHFFY